MITDLEELRTRIRQEKTLYPERYKTTIDTEANNGQVRPREGAPDPDCRCMNDDDGILPMLTHSKEGLFWCAGCGCITFEADITPEGIPYNIRPATENDRRIAKQRERSEKA